MYGLYYDGTPQAPTYAKNDVAFNGIGRPRETLDADVPNLLRSVSNPNARAVHFTYFPSDGFLRDPERIGFRSGPQATTWSGGSRNYFPLNASYTYPDEKDIALAAIRARDGQVISTSFYRPSTFGSLSPDNPNWTNGVGKYLLHRPRPIDMGPGFPAVPANPDGSYTGDVEQLEGKAVRRNDSLWLDLDLPVRTWRGRLYKPLVAFLVTDLDGRINLNMAGNTRGIDDRTASNLGLGGWEIDLQPLFPFDESRRLFQDANGRYGSRAKPSRSYSETGNVAANETAFAMRSPYYAPVDLDGSLLTDSGLRPRMEMPGVPSTRTAPNFPPRYAGGSTAERVDHPSLFNPYLLSTMPSLSSTKPNRAAARRTAYRPRRSIAIVPS